MHKAVIPETFKNLQIEFIFLFTLSKLKKKKNKPQSGLKDWK